MGIVFVNSGETALLQKMIKAPLVSDEDFILTLYTNSVTITPTSVAGDFTAATFTGSGTRTMERADFADATSVGGKGSISLASPLTWTCTAGSETVRGYFVTAGGTLQWAEAFAAGFPMVSGAVLTFTPSLTLFSEN